MVEKRKFKINSGSIIAVLLLVFNIAQIALVCTKVFFGAAMSWTITLLPLIITGACILLAALYFIIGSMLIPCETCKEEEKKNQ